MHAGQTAYLSGAWGYSGTNLTTNKGIGGVISGRGMALYGAPVEPVFV